MDDETAKAIRAATGLASVEPDTDALLRALEGVPNSDHWTVVKGDVGVSIYVLAADAVYRLRAHSVAVKHSNPDGGCEVSDCDCRPMPITCVASYSISAHRVTNGGPPTPAWRWQFRLNERDDLLLEYRPPSNSGMRDHDTTHDLPAFAAALIKAIAEHRESCSQSKPAT